LPRSFNGRRSVRSLGEHTFAMSRRRGPTRPPGETRRLVGELRKLGLSYSEIAERIGAKKSTVAYHARNLGIPAVDLYAKRYDWNAIQAAYNSGLSMRQCQKQFGFHGSSWTQAVNRGDIVPRPRARDLGEMFCKGDTRNGRGSRKKRLIDEGIKEDRCEECGITHWRGRKLSIQLHHKNGDGTDHRIENLELLCPNCHSLTDTYGGRNGHRRRKPRRPS
jgi:hypothetical protein